NADQIRQAFHRFALRYHPDKYLRSDDADTLRRANQIFSRGAEAYRVLLNPEQRSLYDVGMEQGQLRYDPERTDRAPRSGRVSAEVTSIRARPFVKKAQRAMKNQDWSAAQIMLKAALNHEPQNSKLQSMLEEVERELRK
ncbi:MAG: DnaJ domain-containing protein, partial [Myxococcota bacterium]